MLDDIFHDLQLGHFQIMCMGVLACAWRPNVHTDVVDTLKTTRSSAHKLSSFTAYVRRDTNVNMIARPRMVFVRRKRYIKRRQCESLVVAQELGSSYTHDEKYNVHACHQ